LKFDIFFSISQTPANGYLPSEREMFLNFFEQVCAADELGYGTAWVAESHFSSQAQKKHREPVIPHWQGEVGLNADIFQLSHLIFARTRRIETGSAVMNIVCNGGPVAAAEKLATFCSLHGLDPAEKRKIHVGFSAGRFEFMNRTTGVYPRDENQKAHWPAMRNGIFKESVEIFLRLTKGEEISSDDLEPLEIPSFAEAPRTWWKFEKTRIIPREWRQELFQPVIGSHDPKLQIFANRFRPVRVFNLSITRPEIIEETHDRLRAHYHASGGSWQREYMPRTVFVFLNEQPGLTREQKSQRAGEESQSALGAYWQAIEGTLDPKKVAGAADNSLVGCAEEVAEQIVKRFHPQDRLMLWFDFFNHDSKRVIENMEAFQNKVVPLVNKELGHV
jgi:alkanesulfonate monooxygenase SsuD/methylene tetrahydromethanopterin reductase-like flavin-dependent oxidoreductase (luciferase family)